MHISSISYINTSYNRNIKSKPVFTAHPDFHKYNSIQSCYFRRGSVLLSCAKGYEDIENLFCKMFKSNNCLKNMLIIGIGSSQEPFSYLASIKGILKESKLKNYLDLYTVDLQSKPEHNDLKMNAFCDLLDYQSFPKYAESSFVKDSIVDWLEIKHKKNFLNPTDKYVHYYMYYRDKWKELEQKGYNLEKILKIFRNEDKQKNMRWRVNNEIFEFLEQTYKNPQKSKWDSRIQEAILDYPDNKFDIISANNVLPYILSKEEYAQTIKNIVRTLKPNGYFITDPYEYTYHAELLSACDNMKKTDMGIYQKV